MNTIFASYLAEYHPAVIVAGAYDPEQELWIGNGPLQAADGSPLFQTTTNTATTYGTIDSLGCWVDGDIDHAPDAS